MKRLQRFQVVLLMVLALVLLPVLGAGATDPSPPVGELISNSLTGGFAVAALPDRPVTLSWVTQPPTQGIFVGRPFGVSVRAVSLPVAEGGQDIDRALFVITGTKTVGGATTAIGPTDVTIASGAVALGWDAAGNFFFWGPRAGFPLPAAYNATTEFTVTPLVAGTFNFVIQCVELTTP